MPGQPSSLHDVHKHTVFFLNPHMMSLAFSVVWSKGSQGLR
jgi:hypothetical protein